MKKYSVDGQNVIVTYTDFDGGDKEELFAIATSNENAITIAAGLNVINELTKTKS